MSYSPIYQELHRPQFHFTPKRNWTNDPNGLVYYKGEYHLFFQHNPTSTKWGNMTWGHAISCDLVHWEQLPDAIEPDELGTIFSGSAVVDWNNTSGLKTGAEDVLVALYTSAGSHVPTPCAFTQSLAFSNDRGRTWTKYEGNPVIGHFEGKNRDPKVIWHGPSEQWIMALFLDHNDYRLLRSKNLLEWIVAADLSLPGVSECPDFFELPLDGDPADTRWVFWGANGGYLLGRFDGAIFTPETAVQHSERGSNGYAAQTWSDLPETDGRRIQLSWMIGGKYPSMPFNQQLSFPVVLELKRFGSRIELCRMPIREIEGLYRRTINVDAQILTAQTLPITDTVSDLLDLSVTFEDQSAAAFGLIIRGHRIELNPEDRTLSAFGKTVSIPFENGRISLRLLLDRTSVELFSTDGRLSMTCCFLPEPADVPVEVFVAGGRVSVESLILHELASIWK